MPLQATSGAASYDGFGGGPAAVPTYIEDVFSTWLYTGNGSTQTITNGIDLTGQGGLVWIKPRNVVDGHYLADTNRGADKYIFTNSSGSQSTVTDRITSFNSSGFSLGSGLTNTNTTTYASWTFRKQPKFFDVVTYTGNNSAQTISHNLGSVPGVIITKAINASGQWSVYHRSLGKDAAMFLNLTDASGTYTNYWGASAPTATTFQLSSGSYENNQPSTTYVAYLFAHNAGGFGLTGTDNVVSCGSYTGTGAAGNPITLGYEPQYLLIKPSSMSGGWWVLDNMRPGGLRPDSSAAESTSVGFPPLTIQPTATGFSFVGGTLNDSGQTFIYIAIRRGPMKTPTTGTSVYNAIARTGTSATATVTGVGFPPDLAVIKDRSGTTGANWLDRLRGPNRSLRSNSTGAEFDSATDVLTSYDQNGVTLGSDTTWGLGTNTSGNAMINWFFRRAPGFFDEVCYTGNGSNSTTVTHNLSVAPELIIAKARGAASAWRVGAQFTSTTRIAGNLNSSDSLPSDFYTGTGATLWTGQPTATTFTPGLTANGSGTTYVAYLFASCPGVSKVGSYTGNGSSQTINCGFTGGARWVMIKRTDSSGDWYVWDSTRGIVAGNDPRIAIGVGAAEDTSNDSIDTNSTGFIVNQDASNINVSSASYIFLAIA